MYLQIIFLTKMYYLQLKLLESKCYYAKYHLPCLIYRLIKACKTISIPTYSDILSFCIYLIFYFLSKTTWKTILFICSIIFVYLTKHILHDSLIFHQLNSIIISQKNFKYKKLEFAGSNFWFWGWLRNFWGLRPTFGPWRNPARARNYGIYHKSICCYCF